MRRSWDLRGLRWVLAVTLVAGTGVHYASLPGRPLTDRPFDSGRLGDSDTYDYVTRQPSPGLATTRHVLLKSYVRDILSDEAIAFVVEHERSHIEHRDVVGALGAKTLLNAIEGQKNSTLSPLERLRLGRLHDRIATSVAENSREVEYRADLEAGNALLGLGADEKTIIEGAKEIFNRPSSVSEPLSNHPADRQRISALESKLGLSSSPPQG